MFVAKRFVLVAFVVVAFVKTPVDGEVAPMVVLLIVPPSMVRLLASCASVATPVMSAKLIPRVEVAESVYPAPLPTRSCPYEGVAVRPVPPLSGESADASVSTPAELNDEVAVDPKSASVNAENRVVDALSTVRRFAVPLYVNAVSEVIEVPSK
jgi:hypothetical protein